MVHTWAQHISQRHWNPPHLQLVMLCAVNSVISLALQAEALCPLWPPYHAPSTPPRMEQRYHSEAAIGVRSPWLSIPTRPAGCRRCERRWDRLPSNKCRFASGRYNILVVLSALLWLGSIPGVKAAGLAAPQEQSYQCHTIDISFFVKCPHCKQVCPLSGLTPLNAIDRRSQQQ